MRQSRIAGTCLVICLGVLGTLAPATAATLPPGFTETLVAGGLVRPTAMAIAPDGRIFVCEQDGRLRVIRDGALLPTPFHTLSVNNSGERGLLGVAFDPNFASNHFLYVYYTTSSAPIHNRVSRLTANGDVVVPGSEHQILNLETLSATNHNGGAIHFGNDGKLYVAVGENAVPGNSQTLDNRLGKMLRINADGSIPDDNPFNATAMGLNKAIWALGLRNPFTFGVDRVSGRIFINDVGAGAWEEINDGIPGANYGWPDTEGPTTDPDFESPFYAYDRRGTGECAIAGGAFYSPVTMQFPAEYAGQYFFADLCKGWIHTVDPESADVNDFATGITAPVDLKVSDDGSLYYLARGASASAGVLYRVTVPAGSGGNLRISSFGMPSRAASGASIALKDTTTNGGTAATPPTRTGFWFSTNNTLGGDAPLGARSVPLLAPGASNKGTTSVTVPTVTAGTYYLIAEADFDSDVAEADESDNLAVKKLLVGADLTALLVTSPSSPTSTSPTTITVTTKNIGGDLAGASSTRLYRSANGTIDAGDTLIQVFAIPPLAAKTNDVSEVTLMLPAGTYYLIAQVDAGGTVNEVSESNNLKKVKKTVP
jgi:glucose/arabinose dehydrogenase